MVSVVISYCDEPVVQLLPTLYGRVDFYPTILYSQPNVTAESFKLVLRHLQLSFFQMKTSLKKRLWAVIPIIILSLVQIYRLSDLTLSSFEAGNESVAAAIREDDNTSEIQNHVAQEVDKRPRPSLNSYRSNLSHDTHDPIVNAKTETIKGDDAQKGSSNDTFGTPKSQVKNETVSLVEEEMTLSSTNQSSPDVHMMSYDVKNATNVTQKATHSDSSLPIEGKNSSNHTYPFTYAGCLYIKDDNQLLPEWLAYHYTVMPLRHLVIGVDPLSYTRVEPIVEKFRSIGMKIMVLTGNHYWMSTHRMKFHDFDPKNHTEGEKHKHYVHKQSGFYTKCIRILHRQGFQHTMFIDTDEFYSFNQEWDKSFGRNDSSSVENVPDVPKYVGRQNETIAHWVASGADPILSKLEDDDDPAMCVTLPRVLFSSVVSRPEKADKHVYENFNSSLFDTISLQTRGLDIQPGKTLINPKGYRWTPVNNPHKPFGSPNCFLDGSNGITRYPLSHSIHVHHNLGTLETYLRLHPFRTTSTFYEIDKRPREDNVTDTSKTKWLGEFIQLVGSEKAFELTESTRIKAKIDDDEIKERLRKNETVEVAYEWDEPKPEISDEEYIALEW